MGQNSKSIKGVHIRQKLNPATGPLDFWHVTTSQSATVADNQPAMGQVDKINPQYLFTKKDLRLKTDELI